VPNTNQFATLSDSNIDVEYQKSTDGGSVHNEGNFAFYAVNTLFVGINQVGGGTVGDESSRVNGNYVWVKNSMAKYLPRGMRAIVIFAHASMGGSRQQYFGTPFATLLRTSDYAGIKALYVHGDGHWYNAYHPDSNNRNLTSLQVDGGEMANPIFISFTHDTASKATSYNIDEVVQQRGAASDYIVSKSLPRRFIAIDIMECLAGIKLDDNDYEKKIEETGKKALAVSSNVEE
jgi:hypothetical protein